MREKLLRYQVAVRQGAFLPHWELPAATYAVCFRLGDSLPRTIVDAWRHERAALLARAESDGGQQPAAIRARLHELFSARLDQFLDAGHGACWLRRTEVARVVAGALGHFAGRRYALDAWCIMPNHVHAVVTPGPDHALREILKSWKGFSGLSANRLLHRQGQFWQPEYYDHLIRDEAEFVHSVRYLLENPRRAGLNPWPWVWVSEKASSLVASCGVP
jgi:REP element-mobilizing transposase RayT